MTPPSFQIDDEVEIIGPDHLAGNFAFGYRIEITMQWKHIDGMLYSNDDLPWYPASSLRLVEDELKIGDFVEIIGPGTVRKIANWHTITTDGKTSEKYYDLDNCASYHAKSLRKLIQSEIEEHLKPELKIGDWVQVIGSCCCDISSDIGHVFQISEFDKTPSNQIAYSADHEFAYYPKSLRKLTPEEIQQHQQANQIIPVNLNERLASVESETFMLQPWRIEIKERLSAIEQRVNGINDRIDAGVGWEIKFNERQSAIEKRQERIDIGLDEHRQSHAKWRDRVLALEESLDCITGRMNAHRDHHAMEAYHQGELIKALKSTKGYEEMPDCKPTDEYIHVRISRDGHPYEDRTFIDECPGECLKWCEKVLDSMRSGKP